MRWGNALIRILGVRLCAKRQLQQLRQTVNNRDKICCGNFVWFESNVFYRIAIAATIIGESNNSQPAMQTIKPGDVLVMAMLVVNPV